MSISTIRDYAERVGVPFLVHFTRASNLPSILKHGLHPRVSHGELPEWPEINDPLRFDGHLGATSTSIAFPNSKLFYTFRRRYSCGDWVVLILDRSILWTMDCAFCTHNAAASGISTQPIQELQSLGAFARMFEDSVESPTREADRLESFDPTDVQAEVLVFGVIEPSRIQGIVFETPDAKAGWERSMIGKQAPPRVVDKDFFLQRYHVR